MKISIIVPIYNAANYLKRCINSLLEQGLEEGEYEILLINDGSTDDSLKICESFYKKFPKIIRIFSHENQGVAYTRNKGIQEAKGDYIAFVDADDYLIPNGYKYLIDNYLNDSTDILSFWALTLDKRIKANYVEDYQVEGKIDYEINGIDFLKRGVQTFIVTSFYRRTFIVNHSIEFKRLTIGEDVMFNLEVYFRNPYIRMVTSRLYRYDLHEESAIHQRNYASVRKGINSYKYLIETIDQYAQKTNDAKLRSGLQNIAQQQLVPLVSRLLSSDYSIEEFRHIRTFLNEKYVIPFKGDKKFAFLINYIFKYTFLFKFNQFCYQRIFIPYIFPYLSRN